MKVNMGKPDKIIRMILGAAIIAAGIYFQSWWGLAGIIPLGTAFINWCPLYVPFGISTCKKTETSTE
jgi:hypothetical protein